MAPTIIIRRKDIHALEESERRRRRPMGRRRRTMAEGRGARAHVAQADRTGSPPDLEDIIRRGQDRLKNVLPGGGAAQPGDDRPRGAGAGRVLGVPGDLYGAAGRTGGRTALRQAEAGTVAAGPALPLVADRDRREGQHRRKAGRSRRSARQHVVGPDAVGRPEHRRREVLRRLPGRRSRQVSVPGRRTRRDGAPDRRERDARGRRPPSGAGHFPRRPPGHRRRGAGHHPDDARRVRHGHQHQRDLHRGRGAAARGRRRVRRGAARRAGRGPLRRGIQPVFQPEARPGPRRGGAGARRRGRLQEPHRAGGTGRGAALHLGL